MCGRKLRCSFIWCAHAVTFAVVTSAVGKKLTRASQLLMQAYVQRGGRVDLHTITFIQKHFDSSTELFDTCVQERALGRVGRESTHNSFARI